MNQNVARKLKPVGTDASDNHSRLAVIDGGRAAYVPGVDFIGRPWKPHQSSGSPKMRAALRRASATEDSLPTHRSSVDTHFGQDGPGGEWVSRWIAQEDGDPCSLRPFLCATRSVRAAGSPTSIYRPQERTVVMDTVTTAGPQDGPTDRLSSSACEVRGADDGDRCIYLTFDDGPNLFCTPQILDVLAEHRALATFCVIGEYAAGHPELIRRIVAEGHGLASHTMTHRDLSHCAPEEIQQEISRASDVITAISPQTPLRHLRAPYGVWTGEARAAAAALGLAPLDWTVDPRDWSRPGVDAIVETVLTHIRPGGVILLHDGCPPDELPRGDRTHLREQTVAALRRLIPALRDRGFVFRTLPLPSAASAAELSADMPGVR
ncbi:chitooligosaccharide deacetylase NodB [Streptomyces bottropensis]|uniref:chitooligosaccharide deacetylase NodB n=1 Tax=Streptomyces bottropensis TaxID=42235 RepID=UPI0036C8741A